jgi:hypothetical protein
MRCVENSAHLLAIYSREVHVLIRADNYTNGILCVPPCPLWLRVSGLPLCGKSAGKARGYAGKPEGDSGSPAPWKNQNEAGTSIADRPTKASTARAGLEKNPGFTARPAGPIRWRRR